LEAGVSVEQAIAPFVPVQVRLNNNVLKKKNPPDRMSLPGGRGVLRKKNKN
jgi:hypothetical protein